MPYGRYPRKSVGKVALASLIRQLMGRAMSSVASRAFPAQKISVAGYSKNQPSKYTKAKPKPKGLVSKSNIAKGEGVETSFVLRSPPSVAVKNMKKINSHNEVFRQSSSYQAWDVGRQSVSFTQVFAKSDFDAILSQLPARDISANANRRFLLDNYTGELTFANGTNASCYVKIYDIVAKTDVDQSDITAGLGDPTVAWNNGEVQQGNSTGYHVIGSEPKKVDLFKEHFKILSMKQHFMKPGDIHKHHVKINHNKILNEARMSNSVRYAGLTYFTMIVAYGTPAQDDTPTTPIVSTTAGNINWTQTQRFTYRYSVDNQQNSYVLPSLLPQPATLEVVQEDGDIDIVTNA